MASRYIQEFPIPNDFTSIFKNLTKEILRDQPANILHYAACYFHALDQGVSFNYNPDFKFEGARAPEADPAGPVAPPSAEEVQSGKFLDQIVDKTIDEVYSKHDKNNDGSLDLEELRKMVLEFKETGVMPLEK